MLIIARTPVRISFFGGGTDYPPYYLENGGAVLGTTIDQYTHVSIKTLQKAFFEHNIRVAYSKIELVQMIEEIIHPSVRECLKYKGVSGNLDIHFFSDLPVRTGLGSSSSFTVGFLHALDALQGNKISKHKLAWEALHVEQNLIGENVGSQDQFHAAYGGFNVIEFFSTHISVRPVAIPRATRDYLENHLLVFYTGLTRLANEVVQEQVERTKRKENSQVLKTMFEMVGVGEEILMTLSGEKMLKAFGQLLHESWHLKKRLSPRITTPAIDQAYSAAIAAGAYGGKLCGAGGGGFLAFLVPDEKKENVRLALKNLQEVIFRFENEGSTIIYLKD